MKEALTGLSVHITGVVQGVGFRPFVYNLARRLDIRGWVKNTSAGVDILGDGSKENLDSFIAALRNEAPPLARIDIIYFEWAEPEGFREFSIERLPTDCRRLPTNLPRCKHLPGLLAGYSRSAQPALPLPIHKLHQLRPTLHDHHGYPL